MDNVQLCKFTIFGTIYSWIGIQIGYFNFLISVETNFVYSRWPILERVLWAIRRGCIVLCFAEIFCKYLLSYIWCMMPVCSCISLFKFCLHELSLSEARILNSPTITVWGPMCNLSCSSVSFMKLGAQMFRIAISS